MIKASEKEKMRARFEFLESQVNDLKLMSEAKKYREMMREYQKLKEILSLGEALDKTNQDLQELHMLLENNGEDMQELVLQEQKALEEQRIKIAHQLEIVLVPEDPLDMKNVIFEIRAGTGGEEAALFAGDLYRMYQRFCEHKKWALEVMDFTENDLGGMKEMIFEIQGEEAYRFLRFESGVHRVQRVPITESHGRLQTSAATVAVLPEMEETDIQINEQDLRIDVFRAQGAGGQHVNTTDSAVRITHLPTGIVASCQDEKSQHKNKAKALKVLRSRLYEFEEGKKQKDRSEQRKAQVGSGDRSQRIRTYNYAQNRLTDHRVNLTSYNLDRILQGDLEDFLQELRLRIIRGESGSEE